MKVCIMNEFFRPYVTGGVDIFLDELSNFLAAQGIQVKIITALMNKGKQYEKEGNIEIFRVRSSPLNVKNLQQIPGVTFPFNFFNYPLRAKLTKIFRDTDIVHINNSYHLSFAPLQVATMLGKPTVLDVHDYWPICFRKDLLHPTGSVCSQNDPFSCYACLSLTQRQLEMFAFPLAIFLEFYARKNILSKKKNIVAVTHSKFVAKKIKEYAGLDSMQIPYPFFGKLPSVQNKNIGDVVRLTFMGRLQTQKGAHLLTKIAERLREKNIAYEMNVLGDGLLMNKMKREVSKKKLNVKFFGFVTDRRVRDATLVATDILLAPSLWYEPFGIVVLEAMAFGIPVVGSSLGGMADVINENEVGIAVLPSVESVVDAVDRLVADSKLYAGFSKNGLRNIKKYDGEKIFKEYLRLFEQTKVK
jgi:glycosyltransferase involved in cell wall biosynthesis